MADGGESPGPPPQVGLGSGSPEMGGEGAEPGLVEALVDHVEQGPHRPLGQPGIGVAVDAGAGRHGGADQAPGERERDVGAHTVGPPGATPSRVDSRWVSQRSIPRVGHGDDLRRHRIVERLGHHRPEGSDQGVGPLGPMDVQHAGSPAFSPEPLAWSDSMGGVTVDRRPAAAPAPHRRPGAPAPRRATAVPYRPPGTGRCAGLQRTRPGLADEGVGAVDIGQSLPAAPASSAVRHADPHGHIGQIAPSSP